MTDAEGLPSLDGPARSRITATSTRPWQHRTHTAPLAALARCGTSTAPLRCPSRYEPRPLQAIAEAERLIPYPHERLSGKNGRRLLPEGPSQATLRSSCGCIPNPVHDGDSFRCRPRGGHHPLLKQCLSRDPAADRWITSDRDGDQQQHFHRDLPVRSIDFGRTSAPFLRVQTKFGSMSESRTSSGQ
jgi:hypothetical protein